MPCVLQQLLAQRGAFLPMSLPVSSLDAVKSDVPIALMVFVFLLEEEQGSGQRQGLFPFDWSQGHSFGLSRVEK